MFYGIVGAVSGVSSILGACIFAKFQKKIKQKKIINLAIFFGAALGGWLFDRIGLQPLIIVSALFSALSWFIVPYLKLEEKKGE
ncbi:MAG: hypothetical protein Q8P07_04515 [bacterium]|nr:hypothetical protein [bacterium]